MIAISLILPVDKQSNTLMVGSILMFIFISVISNSQFISTYLIGRSNYKKSKLISNLQSYEFADNIIKVSSNNGSFSAQWVDIYKVQEFKSCFLILMSPSKYFIIPRRCFNNAEQLDIFLNIFISKVDSKKLKLKKYGIKKTSPDYGEIITSESTIESIKTDSLVPLVEISFTLNKNEILEMNYRLYYRIPSGIIMTGIGVLCLFIYFKSLFYNGSSILIALFIGLIFTFLVPIMIYFNTIKSFKNDVVLKKSYICKFYSDYFIIDHPNGTSKIKWDDLVKVIEIKSVFLIFATTQSAYIIPKRVFEDKREELQIFREIVSKKFPKIKK